MKQETWEERFDRGCNTDNISDPPSDKEWIKDFIRTEIDKEGGNISDILNRYSEWLEENGYMDSDWDYEEPRSVEAFLKEMNK